MTSHPTPENARCWWLVCGKWRRLHAIPADQITPTMMREAIDQHRPLARRAVCGLRRRWWMPGITSRMGLARCTACCHTLDIPAGHGTPANRAARP